MRSADDIVHTSLHRSLGGKQRDGLFEEHADKLVIVLKYFRKREVIENLILGFKWLLMRGVFVGEEDFVEIYVRRRIDIDCDRRHPKCHKRPRGLHSKSQQF